MVHGFSMTQNETHYDHDANFCNIYNIFRESGVRFEEPTVDDCKFMPKDPRVCSGKSELHPHCELNALYDHDCHTTYASFDKHISGMHPGGEYPSPDGKYYHIKETHMDHDIEGYTTKTFNKGTVNETTWIDALRFQFISIGQGSDKKCAIHGFSESYNETYYDYDANFCNLYNTFNGTGLNFSDPVLSDCLYRPKDLRQCSFASEKQARAKGSPELPFIQ